MDLGQLRYEQIENIRRSIAMLPTGSPALTREDALEVLEELQRLQRAARDLRRALNDLSIGRSEN
jgi:hypothetical protein